MSRIEIDVHTFQNPSWQTTLSKGIHIDEPVRNRTETERARRLADLLLQVAVDNLGNDQAETLVKAGLKTVEQMLAARKHLHVFSGIGKLTPFTIDSMADAFLTKYSGKNKKAIDVRLQEYENFWLNASPNNYIKTYLIRHHVTTEYQLTQLAEDGSHSYTISNDLLRRTAGLLDGEIDSLFERYAPKIAGK